MQQNTLQSISNNPQLVLNEQMENELVEKLALFYVALARSLHAKSKEKVADTELQPVQ